MYCPGIYSNSNGSYRLQNLRNFFTFLFLYQPFLFLHYYFFVHITVSLFTSTYLHQPHKNNRRNRPESRSQQSTRQRISGFLNLHRTKINTHTVKHTLRRTHHHRSHQPCCRIRPILLYNNQQPTPRSTGSNHPHHRKRYYLRRNPHWF